MDAKAGLTTWTRFGFAARGLLYIVIAWLLIGAGRAEDPAGALDFVAKGGGQLPMIIIAGGFIAYGAWRLSDALFNVERHPPGGKGLRQRLAAGASGSVYLLLAWQSVRLIRGATGGDQGQAQDSARTLLALPGGELALIVAGAVLAAVAIFQLIKAVKASFLDKLDPRIAHTGWAKLAGQLGYGARGLIFLISAFFLVKAGLAQRASEAGGIEEALSWLSQPWDMVTATGLFCFGLYSMVEARFRILHRVPVDRIARGDLRPDLP